MSSHWHPDDDHRGAESVSSSHSHHRRSSRPGSGDSPPAKRAKPASSIPSSSFKASDSLLTRNLEPTQCRSVDEFECLNRIEEGTYGVVFRGRERATGTIVALKRLKTDNERDGFPITALREVNILLRLQHRNIVQVKEVVTSTGKERIFLVMEYVEHDLKTLMESMKDGFLVGEVKTLVLQLLSAVDYMHAHWIMHRDLKTSNLLLSHTGILKVGDFGLAREYGTPPRRYTPVVVTLWYRAPELLLGTKVYTTAIDVWSVGCVFAELIQMRPLLTGRSQIDQLQQIFKLLGTPSERIWPGWSELPTVKTVTFAKEPYNRLGEKSSLGKLKESGIKLLNRFLTFDPKQRCTAKEALNSPFFKESPLPIDPSLFPTWPARSELSKRVNLAKSPSAPKGAAGRVGDDDFSSASQAPALSSSASLLFGARSRR